MSNFYFFILSFKLFIDEIMIKKIVQHLLKIIARAMIKKYQPEIIGITGSVGKTSTKEAIKAVLSEKFSALANIKNYNNEIGVPLSVIGAESPGKSFLGWLKVFLKSIGLLLFNNPNYPRILILEMGADKIGDIEYLINFLPLKVAVVTAVSETHLEQFGSIERVAREKRLLVSRLSKDNVAILNFDDERVNLMREKTKARVITYGFKEGADIQASDEKASLLENGEIQGINFKVSCQGKVVPMLLPDVLGRHQIYAPLAAIAVGIIYELNLLDIAEALKKYRSPKGRMKLIKGIKETLIIDDTYNSSPLAAVAALETLGWIRSGRKKIAVLADMLELGNYTEEGHFKVGKSISENKIDILVTVGALAKKIADGAIEAGMNDEKIFSFDNVLSAGKFLQEEIKAGDIILVKGSQGMRMEKVVKELMAEPWRAEELLVRQGSNFG